MGLGLTIVGALLVPAGSALAVVGALGVRRSLPRNRFAGIRTAATLRDDEAFAVGNQVGGPLVLAAGGVASLAGVVVLTAPVAATGWVLTVLGGLGSLVLALAGGVLGNRAAARVPAPEPVGCSGVCAGCSLVDGCGTGSTPH